MFLDKGFLAQTLSPSLRSNSMRGLQHGSADGSGAVRLWTTQGEIGLHRSLSVLFAKKDPATLEEVDSTPSPEKSKEAASASRQGLQGLQSSLYQEEAGLSTKEKVVEERVDLDRANPAEEHHRTEAREPAACWTPLRRKRPSTPARPRKSARVVSEDYPFSD